MISFDRAVIMRASDLYTLDSAELGPSVRTVFSRETAFTIVSIVCWEWERVDQTTNGEHVFRAFLGCGIRNV